MRGKRAASDRCSLVLVRLEYIQAFKLLVQYGEWLESPRLLHLHFEPIFDFIVSDVFEILVDVVEVSVDGLIIARGDSDAST